VNRAAQREQAILLATHELLGEVGYDRLSLDAVAARAHSSKTTIYRRWPGKAELVMAAVRRYAGPPLSPPPDAGSLRADLIALVRAVRDVLVGHDTAVVFGLMTAMRHDPDLAGAVRGRMVAAKADVFHPALARAVARGELTDADPAMAVEVTSAMLFQHLVSTGRGPDDVFIAALVDDALLPILKA
jgi:AcrR family transcriptional regulator